MPVQPGPPNRRFFHILKRYAAGEVSASHAAYDIQAMGIPGYEDPSASEVVLWSKMAGYGIPTESREAAEADARRIVQKLLKTTGAAVLLAAVVMSACRAVPEQSSGPEAAPPSTPAPTTEPPVAAPSSSSLGPSIASTAVPVSKATPSTGLDLNACAQVARGATEPSDARCPAFISDGLREMTATCADVGGRLVPADRASLWSLDVNGDGREEFLYDATDNFHCEGAASVFSCGSLGCPVSLFERRATAWVAIGAMRPTDVPAAEVLPPAPGERYGMLRGGCAGDRPCDEVTYYRWNGSAYDSSLIDVRGNWVDLANDGLWTLVGDSAILAAPSPDATVVGRYPKGTEVVVIGNARDGQYKFVSPCNACQSGFIDPAALRKTF